MFIQMAMVLALVSSCSTSADNRLDCLEKVIAQNKQDKDYEAMKMAITDSIKTWANKGLQNTTSFLPQNSVWKVDEFLFNKDRAKIFGWILKIDKEQITDIPKGEDRNDILDYVEYFTGEKRNDKWYFYIHHMPSIFFARKDNNSQPYSFEYLSKRAKEKAVEGGVIKNADCDVNYKYINEWIDREGRDLFKWHQRFLKTGDNK